MAKAEQTEAVVVDQMPGLVISQMQPGLAIVANFEELDARIARMVEEFGGMTVEQDYVKEAKKIRAHLNAEAKDLDQRAKEVERLYSAPATAFRARVKQSIEPIVAASKAIDEQVKEFEQQERERKHAELRKHYDDYAGALAEAIPYDRIHVDSWLLRGTNIMAAFEAIEERVNGIARDHETLSTLGLAHEAEAKAEYLETLDLSSAINRSKAIEKRLAEAAELEAVKAANLAAQEEANRAAEAERTTLVDVPQDAEPVPAPPAAAKPAEARLRTFSVVCTDAEAMTIGAAIKALGFTGTVTK